MDRRNRDEIRPDGAYTYHAGKDASNEANTRATKAEPNKIDAVNSHMAKQGSGGPEQEIYRGFSHFDPQGNAVMVDVTEKAETERIAVASGRIRMNVETFASIADGSVFKGDVLGVARVAGIMAAKKTWELIPMCHPLMLTKCTINFELWEESREIEAIALTKVAGKTGVEMEALTAVSTALLTIYDMCKSMDRGMEIIEIHLQEKDGGKSGRYLRKEPAGKTQEKRGEL